MQPRYGLIVQRNGICEAAGTRLIADFAWISWKRMSSASGASKRRTVAGSRWPGSRVPSLSSVVRLLQRTNTCSQPFRTSRAGRASIPAHDPIDHLDLVVTSLEQSLDFHRGLLQPLGYWRESEIVGERLERERS